MYHYNKGLSLAELNRHDEALEAYNQAIILEPEEAENHSRKGDALYELQRYSEALVAYEMALKIKPDYPEYISNKIKAQQKVGLEKEAKEKVTVTKEQESKSISETMPDLEQEMKTVQPPVPLEKLSLATLPTLFRNPITMEQKHTGIKRKTFHSSIGTPKLSHPIMPQEWETYLKEIRTTSTGNLSTAKNNCAELLNALVKGTVQNKFEPALSRPSKDTFRFEARTVERIYGKIQQKRYLALEDSFTSYLGPGLHRWLKPPHKSYLRDEGSLKEYKLITLKTVEEEGFEPIIVTRVDLEARLQKLARESGGWALIGIGFSRLILLSDGVESARKKAEQQLLKTPGHFCGVYVVTPEFNAEHGNKLKENEPFELITFLEPQAIYPGTEERCIAHRLEALFNIVTEDQEIIAGDIFDHHFSLLVLNTHDEMEASAKNKRLKEEQKMIFPASPISRGTDVNMEILPPEDSQVFFSSSSSMQTMTTLLNNPIMETVSSNQDEKNILPPAPVLEESKRQVSAPSTASVRFLSGPRVKPEAITSVQSLQTLKKTLQKLSEEKGYRFNCKRLEGDQLQLVFTAFEIVSAFGVKKVEIQTQLAAFTKLLRQCMLDCGLPEPQTKFQYNFKTWALTIKGESTILDSLEQLLRTTGLIAVADAEVETEICRMQ